MSISTVLSGDRQTLLYGNISCTNLTAVKINGNPVPPSFTPSLGDVLAFGNDASNNNIIDVNLTETANLYVANVSLGVYPQTAILFNNNVDMQNNNLLNVGGDSNVVLTSSYNYQITAYDSSLSLINAQISVLFQDSCGFQSDFSNVVYTNVSNQTVLSNFNILNDLSLSGNLYVQGLNITSDLSNIAFDLSNISTLYTSSSYVSNTYLNDSSFNAFQTALTSSLGYLQGEISALDSSLTALTSSANYLQQEINNITGSGFVSSLNSLDGYVNLMVGTMGSAPNISVASQNIFVNIPITSSSTINGLVSNTTQTINGDKTFNGVITASQIMLGGQDVQTEFNTLFYDVSNIYMDLSNVALYINGLTSSMTQVNTEINTLFIDVSNIYMDLSNVALYINALDSSMAYIESQITGIESSGIVSSLNGLNNNLTLVITTSGTVPNILTASGTIFLGLPPVSGGGVSLGLINNGTQTIGGIKTFSNETIFTSSALMNNSLTVVNGLTVDNHTATATLTAGTITSSGFFNVDSSGLINDLLTVGSLSVSGTVNITGAITASGGITYTGGLSGTGACGFENVFCTSGLIAIGGATFDTLTCSGNLTCDSSGLFKNLLTVGSLTSSGAITSSSIVYHGTELQTTLNTYELSSSASVFTSSAYVHCLLGGFTIFWLM